MISNTVVIVLMFSVPITLFFSITYLVSFMKWKESEKISNIIKTKKHLIFEDLKVSSISYGRIKSTLGFEVKAKIYVVGDFLIITPMKMKWKLFLTLLPLTIENKKNRIRDIKLSPWNAVHVVFLKNTLSLGNATVELTIETKNKIQKQEIFDLIKDWN